SYARSSFGQEGCTWRFGPLRVSCAVVAAKIAEPGSAQQGITGCMGDHVTVGVTVGTYFIFEQHTSNVHRPSWCQPMNVDANSGATRGCLQSQEARTSSRRTSALSSSTRSARAS